MYRTRENFGILVKQREKIKRSFWNFLYLEKYYTTKSSNFLACLPNQNQSKGYVQLGFTNVSTHTASWLVKPGCLLIGWTLTFNISAQRPRNQNPTKGVDHQGSTLLVDTYWLLIGPARVPPDWSLAEDFTFFCRLVCTWAFFIALQTAKLSPLWLWWAVLMILG